jgi:hypothetical protein
MSLDSSEDNQTFCFSIDIGVQFGLFKLSLSHVKIDHLGRVSRFILTALEQEGASWSHLEQVIGLDRIALKPIESRLQGLGYLDRQGELTELGRVMAGIVTLMETPKRVWVDSSHSDWACKKRLMVLDKDNLLGEAEDPDTLLILGEKNKQKKQLDDIQATINSWRYQGIFADVLKRIWPDGSHLFGRADIINDLDISCITIEPSDDFSVSKVVNYKVDLFSGSAKPGWKFYRPVLVCQREVLFGDSAPECLCKTNYSPLRQSSCLLSHQLLGHEINLKEKPGQFDCLLDDYFETDEAGVLDQLSDCFSNLVAPVFADIKYSFSKAYSELNLDYDGFYSEASGRLQALPLFMDKNGRDGK